MATNVAPSLDGVGRGDMMLLFVGSAWNSLVCVEGGAAAAASDGRAAAAAVVLEVCVFRRSFFFSRARALFFFFFFFFKIDLDFFQPRFGVSHVSHFEIVTRLDVFLFKIFLTM
jgi:hypothetical protein